MIYEKLRVFSDPHIGKSLKANTTPASRARLARKLSEVAIEACKSRSQPIRNGDYTLCAGDLFDTHSNPESVLIAGAKVMHRCHAVLGGNHDVINVAGAVSSLEALNVLSESEPTAVIPSISTTVIDCRQVALRKGTVLLCLVPHHATKELFEAAIAEAAEIVRQAGAKELSVFYQGEARDKPTPRKILVLHCNYALETLPQENVINLSEEAADKLLEVFDYILIGHDHHPRTAKNGRVIIIGNTFPTGFGDLGAKFTWSFDGDTWEREPLSNSTYVQVPAEQVVAIGAGELDEVPTGDFIDVVGTVKPEQVALMSKGIKRLWASEPYAVRASKVEIQKAGAVLVDRKAMNILDAVAVDLTGEMLGMFNRARALVEGEEHDSAPKSEEL